MKIWYLQWRSTLSQERHREIPLAKNFFTVGRSPDNDLQLDDPSISRVHAILRKLDDGVMVEDADSVNGLLVEGEPTSKAMISPGSSFEMGNFAFTIVRHSMMDQTVRRVSKVDSEPEDDSSEEDTVDPKTASEIIDQLEEGEEGPHLIELDPNGGSNRTIPLTGSRLSFGRSKKCDVTLTDRRISRHHADFINQNGSWRLVDCSSGNGISLEDGKVKELELIHGSRFCLGSTWFIYSESDESEADTLLRQIPSWDEASTADHPMPEQTADFATRQVPLVNANQTTKQTPVEAMPAATVSQALTTRAMEVEPSNGQGSATQRAGQPPALPAQKADSSSKQPLSSEEFLKAGEPCSACGKKLDEGALYCGQCGRPTAAGTNAHFKRREGGLWSLIWAWLCLGSGLIFWAWDFPGAGRFSAGLGIEPVTFALAVISMLAFFYYAAILNTLGHQTEAKTHGLQWIPLLNLVAMTKIARLNGWRALILLVPGLNIAIFPYVWWRIAYYRRKPRWIGLLVLLPIFGLFVPLYLAHEMEEINDSTEQSLCNSCGVQARRHDRFCGHCGYPRP